MKALLLGLFLAAGGLGWAQAAVDRSPPSSEAATAWWAPFADPVLAQVAQRAGPASAAQLAAVQSYVAWRVAQARELMAARLQQAAAEQQRLLQEGGEVSEERTRWATTVAARAQHWAGVQQLMAGERERAEVTLAALTRSEAAAVQGWLAAATAPLPEVRADMPALQQTSSDAPLQSLRSAAAQAQQAQQLLQASELDLRARQLRQQAGADNVLNVLEAYQRLMADADRLAALSGAVAVAWAVWLQGGGVAALASTEPVSQVRDRDRALPAR